MGLKIGPSYFFSKHGDLSFLLLFFETALCSEHLVTVSKNCLATFISEESP